MKITLRSSFITASLTLLLLPSCSLLGSALKIPASVAQTLGRTVGVSGLTDEAPQPEPLTESDVKNPGTQVIPVQGAAEPTD